MYRHFKSDLIQNLYIRTLTFRLREISSLNEHLMFKWYMTENFSLSVPKMVVLVYGFLLYFNLKDIDILGSSPLLPFHVTASVCSGQFHAPSTNTFMLFWGSESAPACPGHWPEHRPPSYLNASMTVSRSQGCINNIIARFVKVGKRKKKRKKMRIVPDMKSSLQ